jgi:hypothetical protein
MIYINSNYYVILSLLNTKHRWDRKKHNNKMKRIKKLGGININNYFMNMNLLKN